MIGAIREWIYIQTEGGRVTLRTAILSVMFGWVLALLCKVKGHDLVDEGYGTPESGCIEIRCRRCGFSHGRTWLY